MVSLIGAPGSGKTVIGKILESEGFVCFVTGDLFRKIATEDSGRGKIVNHIVTNRLLVPPEIARPIIQAALEDFLGADKAIIMDGYPRNLGQLSILDTIHPAVYFIEIAVDFETCRKRIEAAKDRGNRIDDKDTRVREQGFKTYENETVPMIGKIEKERPRQFLSVDGLPEPEVVAQGIANWIKGKA